MRSSSAFLDSIALAPTLFALKWKLQSSNNLSDSSIFLRKRYQLIIESPLTELRTICSWISASCQLMRMRAGQSHHLLSRIIPLYCSSQINTHSINPLLTIIVINFEPWLKYLIRSTPTMVCGSAWRFASSVFPSNLILQLHANGCCCSFTILFSLTSHYFHLRACSNCYHLPLICLLFIFTKTLCMSSSQSSP